MLKYIRSGELSVIMSISIAKPTRSCMLSLLFTLAPKPREDFKSRLYLCAIHPHCTHDTIAGTKVEDHGFFMSPRTSFYPLQRYQQPLLPTHCGHLDPPSQEQKQRAKPILAVYLLRLSNCRTVSSYILHEKHETPPPANAFFEIFS